MAGIYIHIPFCKHKCHYCDFHFSTDTRYTDDMLRAIEQELMAKTNFLGTEAIQTLYFGGGTPSIVADQGIGSLISHVRAHFDCAPDMEITLEANPEDLTQEKLNALKAAGIQRLSIGIQSFDDAVLSSMNRSHDAHRARAAVKAAQDLAFDQISVDIIYGRPAVDKRSFEEDLAQFVALDVDHISAYALTIEPRTVYHALQAKGELTLPADEVVAAQFDQLVSTLADHGYEQYEVSNFARSGCISRHNSAYWSGTPYLGLGPSAHSYDGESRYWNVANNHKYMQAIKAQEPSWESELLSPQMRYNEYVLTRSRTKWGLDLEHIRAQFGVDVLQDHAAALARYTGRYHILDGHLILDQAGLMLADGFAADLFIIES